MLRIQFSKNSYIYILCLSLLLQSNLKADSPVNIYTPQGTLVGDSYDTDEMHYTWREYYDNEYSTNYPNAEQIKLWGDSYSSSRKYNCHGYAWHMIGDNSINDPVWIGYNSAGKTYKYWEDESYTAVSEQNATIVDYSGDHSAVTTNEENIYISKWNKYPLVKHHKDDHPGYGNPQGFYKKTPFSVKIEGPTTLIYNGLSRAESPHATGTWSVDVINAPSSYTYQWSQWSSHNQSWVALSGFNNSNLTKTINRDTEFRVVVSSNGETCKSTKKVYLEIWGQKAVQDVEVFEIILSDNTPNPFNPTTQIKFGLPEMHKVKLDVYSLTGKKIKTLVNSSLEAGYHTINWDATNENGAKVSSGVYIYQLRCGNEIFTKKMIFVK